MPFLLCLSVISQFIMHRPTIMPASTVFYHDVRGGPLPSRIDRREWLVLLESAIACSFYPSGMGRFNPLSSNSSADIPEDVPPGQSFVAIRRYISSSVPSFYVHPFPSYLEQAVVTAHIVHSCGVTPGSPQTLSHADASNSCFFFFFCISRPRFGDLPSIIYRLFFGVPTSVSIEEESPVDVVPASDPFLHRSPVFFSLPSVAVSLSAQPHTPQLGAFQFVEIRRAPPDSVV
jgi:hypothetical protein